MTTAAILLQDFDVEMQNTRTTLERIPEDRSDFKPHIKSMPCGRLAAHVSQLPRFGISILTTDELNMANWSFPKLVFESREKLLADFDALAAEARSHLAAAPDDYMQKNWKLAWGDKVIADAPRSLLYRTMFFNHLIHHRAQLGVYLRLNDLPVPPLYGPSADDTLGF
ncbi:DinB family protein [Granulicella arctica]|uniref:DinB family protein n=1 Tax=Granulicella arctica TaxID=940613 RepID=UPI0021E011AB|nr:DinB family protein [Granulicella arctica]